MKSAIFVNSRFITEVKTNYKPQTPPRLITVLNGSDTAQSFTRSTNYEVAPVILETDRSGLQTTAAGSQSRKSGDVASQSNNRIRKISIKSEKDEKREIAV